MANNKAQKKLASRKLLLIVLGVLLVGVAGWFFVADPILDQRDKDRFLHAEARLEQVLDDKILPVAEPDHIEREQSCRYSGTKFSRGINCKTQIHLAYTDLNTRESGSLVADITSSSFSMVLGGGGTFKKVQSPDTVFESYNQASQQLFDTNGLSCSIRYLHPITQTQEDLIFENIATRHEGMHIILSCSGPARAKHFPLSSR